MTWPGAPTIYYGDEAGVCGFTDPDNRRTYPWGHEDNELVEFHRDIIKIHKENEELLTGSLKILLGEYNYLCYGRFNSYGATVVVINNNDHEITKEIPVCFLGVPKESVMKRLMLSTEDGHTTQTQEYPVVSGKVSVTLAKTSAIILKYKKPSAKNFLLFG